MPYKLSRRAASGATVDQGTSGVTVNRGTCRAIVGVSSGARVDLQAKQQWNTMALTSAVITDGHSELGCLAIEPFLRLFMITLSPSGYLKARLHKELSSLAWH